MRCFLSLLVPVIGLIALCGIAALGQGPTYRLGKTPSAEEIRAWDIAVGPEGKELPAGNGTAKEGAKIYVQRCAYCHGPTGAEGPSMPGSAKLWPYEGSRERLVPSLLGGKATPLQGLWQSPFATTLWDWINRAKPSGDEGSLSTDEVYALSALLLYWNGIIQESDVIDAKSLPKIPMPNRNGFVPSRLDDIRLPRCPGGTCP